MKGEFDDQLCGLSLEKSLYSWSTEKNRDHCETIMYFNESAAAIVSHCMHLKQYQSMDGDTLTLFLMLMWRSAQRHKTIP